MPELAAFVSCRAVTRGADLSGMPGSVKGDSEPFQLPLLVGHAAVQARRHLSIVHLSVFSLGQML